MARTTSEARRDPVRLIERVNPDRLEVEIASKHGSAVLISKDEFDTLVETSYLLSSPANAERLMSALGSVQRSDAVAHDPSGAPQRGLPTAGWPGPASSLLP